MRIATDASELSLVRAGLPALPSDATAPSDIWTEVHDAVQDQFAIVEREVRRMVADIVVTSNFTKGGQFHLFTYRTFSVPDAAIDPVVLGLTFSSRHDGISIQGDVSGEQTGDAIFSLPAVSVPESSQQTLEAARDMASQLCQSSVQIANALQDKSRKID